MAALWSRVLGLLGGGGGKRAVAGGRAYGVAGGLDFMGEVARNGVWYRGDAAELAAFYGMSDDGVGNRSFWAAGNSNRDIRKIHSGLPALIVDVISDIVVDDLVGISVNSGAGEASTRWDAIARENDFCRVLKRAVREAVTLGDGAFRISFDAEVSGLPIIEFFGGDRVRFVYRRGRIYETVLCSRIVHEAGGQTEQYLLEEIYGSSGIRYMLKNERGEDVPLDYLEATRGLRDIKNLRGFSLAVPLIFDENPRFAGRGKSIFDGKIGAFDALDEALSQWVDALRDGRAQKYIPSGLLPRDPHTGEIRRMNAFESRFIQTEMDMAEGADNSIKMVQPSIDTAALSASVANFTEAALQGILAPATLGIDTKRRDNAEAQREKEKITLYTRGRIISGCREALRHLVEASLRAYDCYYGLADRRYDVSVEFGEYGSPDFGTQVDVVGKGVAMGVISVENAVEQLYGNTWSVEQKVKEVERLRQKRNGGGYYEG